MTIFEGAYAQLSPSPKHEVRAVWLATIGGIDWPRTKAHSPSSIEAQKRELTATLDRLKAANFNIVILQTRIRATVIYPSSIEPWDACLTGHANRSPGYDPLDFAVKECHKRGMQIHAWVVAFPANSLRAAGNLGSRALHRRHPELCMRTDDGWMLNPGVPATANYLASLCREVVERYDVDGINLDYIRYPEQTIHYSDAASYRRYGAGQNKAEWRRDNVTRCVRAIHDAVKAIKPWVILSCSPVGKANDLPRQWSGGWNAYKAVHQDAQQWLKDGLMDMLMPMMYFTAGKHFYPFLLDWQEQSGGRPIAVGLGAYKLSTAEGDWTLRTIEQEIRFSRTIDCGGQTFFRSKYVTDNEKGLYDLLQRDLYRQPALPPPLRTDTADSIQPPAEPQIQTLDNGFRLSWSRAPSQVPVGGILYNVYSSPTYPVDVNDPATLRTTLQDSTHLLIRLMTDKRWLPYYAVTAVNRWGQESKPLPLNSPESQIVSFTTDSLIFPLHNGDIRLRSVDGAFVEVCDETGRAVWTRHAASTLPTGSLQPGLYTVKEITRKGRTHILGRYYKKH